MKRTANKLILRLLFIFIISYFPISIFAQDSSRLRIALLTCTPGSELYSTFGHSAFRVTDSNSVNDIVYNYGTFNFDDDNFYLKFVRGKLLYCLSLEYYEDFKNTYQYDNRGITEQVLNLTGAEKKEFQRFLNENAKEENRYYKYDFFFDNCTTRLRDILKKHDSSFCKIPVMPAGTTFRQAIHFYLDKTKQPWSKLGIDILLGVRCDWVMTPEQMQFLPDNLMKALDSSGNMVVHTQSLYPFKDAQQGPLLTAFVFFTLLFLLVLLLSFSKSKWAIAFVTGFDGLLFFFTGLLGVILVFMSTATDHSMCHANYNLLWAWPTHLFLAFFVNSKKKWVQYYFGFTCLGVLLVLLLWFFLPQQMNNALIPFLLLVLYRAALKYYKIKATRTA